MTTLTLKNHLGHMVEVPAVAATEAKNAFGSVLDTAIARGMVAITKRDRPRAVLISFEEYNALVAALPDPIAALRGEFDALVAKMQTPKAKKAARGLFRATPAALGRAAVTAAKRG